jgi:lipid II:glycine glycyltransferase (peptidoglycan interpeptide bridge formation enzyme)
MPELNFADWDFFIGKCPEAHILQTSPWGKLKSSFGWKVHYVVIGEIGAQIFFRKFPGGLTFAYVPKGPIVINKGLNRDEILFWKEMVADQSWSIFWKEIDQLCRHNRSIFLKVEPDIWQSPETPTEMTVPDRFHLSRRAIQPPQTVLIDLRQDEDSILSRMKQKTRYNIRLARKKGVLIQASQDIEQFHRLLVDTGQRDHFQVHSRSYYQLAYDLFHPLNECELFFAQYEGETIAGLMVFAHGKRAWYFYGSSSNKHREYMPAYGLQWEAMRWARSRGCEQYDLWGIPDLEESELEQNFLNRTEGLWGVYRFKRGFGGVVRRSLGPWDRIYNRPLYALYDIWQRRVK